jgi:hypothetical protein
MHIEWQTYDRRVLKRWNDLLESNPEELEIQEFLELNPAMIPGGSGDIGPGGHHGSEMGAVFRKPRLSGAGREFEPDFMWVTRSTALITPILIEIEKPSKRWFKQDGTPTQDFTHAHDQLNDWRAWFSRDQNSAIFRDRFLFFDDYSNRRLEPQFVLIYGRKSEFEVGGRHTDPDSLRRKRDSQRLPDETFMTFDSLRPRHDVSSSITITMTAQGPKPFAVSPTFCTGSSVGPYAVKLGPLDEALDRAEMMSADRREYLADRWMSWRAVEEARMGRSRFESTGRE